MKRPDINRRDFNRLTVAAFGGMMAGSLAGCEKPAPAPATPEGGAEAGSTTADDHDHDHDHAEEGTSDKDVSLLLKEPHVCRGLNTCKGTYAGIENECAGLGACATVAEHACAGNNECKGQGGCGTNPGMNSCKGKGSCHIPLMENAWKLARAEFEKEMEKAGKKVGPAPEPKKK